MKILIVLFAFIAVALAAPQFFPGGGFGHGGYPGFGGFGGSSANGGDLTSNCVKKTKIYWYN